MCCIIRVCSRVLICTHGMHLCILCDCHMKVYPHHGPDLYISNLPSGRNYTALASIPLPFYTHRVCKERGGSWRWAFSSHAAYTMLTTGFTTVEGTCHFTPGASVH